MPRTLFAWPAFIAFASFAFGQKPELRPDPNPAPDLSDATIAAYEKLGASYGAFVGDHWQYFEFKKGKGKLVGPGLVGFKFEKQLPNADLPAAEAPFAIEFHGRAATDGQFKHFANLKTLKWLDASFSHIGDDAIAELAKLPAMQNLEGLKINSTNVTPAALKSLNELKGLRVLDLYSLKMDDPDLKQLKDLEKLEVLILTFCPAHGTGLADLKHLKNLQTVHLDSRAINDDTLKTLRGIDKLHWLNICESNGLKRVKSDKEIQRILLGGVTSVTEEGLKNLKGLDGLNQLLWFVTKTDATLKSLAEVGLLHALSDASGKGGKRPTKAEDVTAFCVPRMKVSDKGVKEMLIFKNLEVLMLTDTEVTDESIPMLIQFKKLQTLYVERTKITEEGIKTLKKGLPDCGIVAK